MFDWKMYEGNNPPWIKESTIFLTTTGSRAYGLDTPESDWDFRGIAIPPKKYFLGYLNKFEQAEWKHPYDCTIFDIRKFFQLASDCNPNIIEILFSDPLDWHICTPLGRKLVKNRNLFLSQKARHTFSGYAMAQLKRIKTHKKWLLKPPDHKPTREEFGLLETSLLSQDILGTVRALDEKGVDLTKKFSSDVVQLYTKERTYHNAMREWEQYQTWKKNRNPKRAELEEKYGYDSKHASHLYRLLTMGEEIITTGQVIVKRPDREKILAIKQGAWEYEELVEWAEQSDRKLTDLLATSPLPHHPDRNRLDGLCQELVEEFGF